MEEILQVLKDIVSIGMTKRLLEWAKGSHWNTERGNSEYFHRFARRYPTG